MCVSLLLKKIKIRLELALNKPPRKDFQWFYGSVKKSTFSPSRVKLPYEPFQASLTLDHAKHLHLKLTALNCEVLFPWLFLSCA